MTRATVVQKAGGARVDAVSAEEARSDLLFMALDGRTVRGPEGAWVVQVTGIHRFKNDVFVQVSPLDDPLSSIVLRMATHATTAHAVAALEAHSPLPYEERQHVVEVMKVARTGGRRPLPAC